MTSPLSNFATPPEMLRFWQELWAGEYEANAEFESPPHVLDIGACIGAAAVWYRLRYPGCTVDSYEPNPKAHKLLDRNVRSHDGVVVHKSAVLGSRDLSTHLDRVEKTIRLHQGRHNLGEASVYVETGALPDEYVDVPVTFARDLPACDILKADCEGPEREILIEYLDTHSPPSVVAVEYHSAGEGKRMQSMMAAHGYRLVRAHEYDPNRGVNVWRLEPEIGP